MPLISTEPPRKTLSSWATYRHHGIAASRQRGITHTARYTSYLTPSVRSSVVVVKAMKNERYNSLSQETGAPTHGLAGIVGVPAMIRK